MIPRIVRDMVILVGAAQTCLAAPLQYQVEGVPVAIEDLPQKHLRISQACVQKGKLECDAYVAAQKATVPRESERSGGQNPGSLICHQEGGQVVIALDNKGNELSFCKFKDGSLISSGSLSYWAYSANRALPGSKNPK